MNCGEVDELSGAYALQALPLKERARVHEHLLSCGRHDSVRELQRVAAALAGAAPEGEPPLRLRTRLLAALREKETAATAKEAPAPEERPRWWRLPRPALPLLAGALALAVAALAAWNVYLQTSDESSAAFVFSISGSGATGTVVYVPEEDVVVMRVRGLQSLGPEQVYQVWALTGERALSMGFLEVTEGDALAAVEADLSSADEVAVTIEPAGGSLEPTSEPVLRAAVPPDA